jgi:hypothetical protein
MATFEIPEVIKTVVAKSIERKEWRSAAEESALANLRKASPAQRQAVKAYVKAEYDKAGAGFAGRWQ